MNLLNLRYFVDIVTCGSISNAARRNLVSQQSMSDHLKKLEQYYETPLLTRAQPQTLTPAGELLFRSAREILEQLDRTREEIRALSAQAGFLGVGLAYNDVPPFFGELLQLMGQECPQAEVRVFDNCAGSARIPDEAELIIASVPPARDWTGIPLFEDRVAVVVRSDLLDKVYGASRPRIERDMRESGDPPQPVRAALPAL